jgi:hypothetical protein
MFFIKLLLRAGFWPPVVDRTLKKLPPKRHSGGATPIFAKVT